MGFFLRVFGCRSVIVYEEVMFVIGVFVYVVGFDFVKYMFEFYKYLEMGF